MADYIANDSPGYAASFIQRIREQARSLDEFAMRGRVVPEIGDHRVRELLIGNYRLIFEIHERTVYILGVIHGARDLAALWKLEGRSDMEKPS
ncbi:MAG: type II toxin-antitoxin system RelE/ParE family toxin [Acidobacteria bacterium]|nr:type II toxin-antitoxin system RelE/ParE family toxin [Acidobacteriota bacterium]